MRHETPQSAWRHQGCIFMLGCMWEGLWWWPLWRGRGLFITSMDISSFWLQWWQNLRCRGSDSGIQKAQRNMSEHGVSEECLQSNNKPTTITPNRSPCFSLTWRRTCRETESIQDIFTAPLTKNPLTESNFKSSFNHTTRGEGPLSN